MHVESSSTAHACREQQHRTCMSRAAASHMHVELAKRADEFSTNFLFTSHGFTSRAGLALTSNS
jgi:hypothetical protein